MRDVWKVMRPLTLFHIWGFPKLWFDFVSKLMSTYFLNTCSRPFCDILCSVVAVGYITSLSERNLCLISSCVSISNTQKSQGVSYGLLGGCCAGDSPVSYQHWHRHLSSMWQKLLSLRTQVSFSEFHSKHQFVVPLPFTVCFELCSVEE
jgi:hypothetical protein